MFDTTRSERLNRREWLRRAAFGTLLTTGAGGIAWATRAHAVERYQEELISKARQISLPVEKAELSHLPAKAGGAIRLYFHRLCLDTHAFVAEIASPRFVERLSALSSEELRHQTVLGAFERHVATPQTVLSRMQSIAEDIGAELDQNWQKCSTDIGAAWEVTLRKSNSSFKIDELAGAADPVLREQIELTVSRVTTAIHRPAFSEAPIRIGEAAVSLFPVIRAAPYVGWPVFATIAITEFLRPLVAFITAPTERELRHEVSTRLAALGKQLADEFEDVVGRQIGELHQWRGAALAALAASNANSAVRWL